MDIKSNIRRLFTKFLSWFGVALLYFALFSLLFDTPAEYEIKHSTDTLKEQYDSLCIKYELLDSVVNNIVERDKNIFAILFESEPYNFESEYQSDRVKLRESLQELSSRQMKSKLTQSIDNFESRLNELAESSNRLRNIYTTQRDDLQYIPSIQPVTNHSLSLLTAGYGMLMHPFYRTLQSHQGVDYTIPEGSRVFATADGVVKEIVGKNSTTGLTLVIDHGNGYSTSYSHLGEVKVKKGSIVKRGDIVANSGNSGLSLSPHLHYEVRYEGVRVDPIHYFFMELTPEQYKKIIRIAQSGMQAFD